MAVRQTLRRCSMQLRTHFLRRVCHKRTTTALDLTTGLNESQTKGARIFVQHGETERSHRGGGGACTCTHDSKVLSTPTALTAPVVLDYMHDSYTLCIAVQRVGWLEPDPWS